MTIKIYADGADVNDMILEYRKGSVSGFTTNPSLMKKAVVSDYKAFAKDVLTHITDLPVSFEVFGDDFDTMEKEALVLKNYGHNVFVKIPIQNSKGESSVPLIQKLSHLGVNINVTAIFTLEQVEDVVQVVSPKAKTIVSIFAGRLADIGVDPIPVMTQALTLCHTKPNIELLWASTREVFNIIEADRIGVDIITVPNDLLKKRDDFGKDPNARSLETVQQFVSDIKSLGFSIL